MFSSLLLELSGVQRVNEPSAASVRRSGVVGSGQTGLQQDLLGAGWCFSLWSCDRKWRHLSALRYNGDHIAVTLGSLYRHPPPPTSPPPSPDSPLTPPQLLLSGGRCSGQQQHHNQTSESLRTRSVCRSAPGRASLRYPYRTEQVWVRCDWWRIKRVNVLRYIPSLCEGAKTQHVFCQ